MSVLFNKIDRLNTLKTPNLLLSNNVYLVYLVGFVTSELLDFSFSLVGSVGQI